MPVEPIVELGARKIQLSTPTSPMVIHEIAFTAATNRHRAAAAALMVCWPPEAQPKGKNRRQKRKNRQKKQDREERIDKALDAPRVKRPRLSYSGQPLQDGGAFVDALMKQSEKCGITYGEIFAAGSIALALVLSQIVTEGDLQEAEEDFFDESEAPAEE